MIIPSYLELLDDSLREGLKGVSEDFIDAQANFVIGCQQPDGGFRGRQGDSDLYYTDFAVRCLSVLERGREAIEDARGYLERHAAAPRSLAEIFNLLNLRRMVQGCSIDVQTLTQELERYILPSGGFARFLGDRRVSAYHTFLGGLCMQMLGTDLPSIDNAIRAVHALKRADGGYAEMDGQAASQTNATAAAVAFLMLHNALSPEQTADTIGFLAGMQGADGGLKPHDAVEQGDLLSTFTGTVALTALEGLSGVKTAEIAGFLRAAAHPGGGFAACAGDDSPDVEYTYYGLGVVAVLRAIDS